MPAWTQDELETITSPEEVRLATRRPDGSLRSARIIWIVRVRDRVFIRSTNGREAAWFRGATGSARGQLDVGASTYDVRFTEADDADLDAVDAAYRQKYGRYASIVDHLLTDSPRSATLEVDPD